MREDADADEVTALLQLLATVPNVKAAVRAGLGVAFTSDLAVADELESGALVAPKIRKDLDIPESVQREKRATFTRALEALDTGWLATSRYLVGEAPTLADFAAYVEIGQLRPGFTNVYDFSQLPNVRRWLDDMMKVPGHDEVHVVLRELGDISEAAPDMDTIRSANKAALRTLRDTLAAMAG